MKLSEITATLRDIRVEPVKTLGQNFLHDQNLARWMVERAELSAEDFVIEIGPGLGALTEFALRSGARVTAIEKDARLAAFLRVHFAGQPLEVLHEDALDYDVRELFARRRAKVIGNLPYYVASQLLLRFVECPSPISLAVFMLQKEMARRLSARPGNPDYGALSLIVQRHWHVEYLRSVPASVFVPRPAVDSAFVRLTPRPPAELPEHDETTFATLVREGFSQRRKQLQNLLGARVPDWNAAAQSIGFEPRARAEELTLEQWIGLTNIVAPLAPPAGAGGVEERFTVVDAHDRPIGEERRSIVHANNLRHRAVHLLVFNRAGELFLQKRSRHKDRHPGVWDSSAAGHVDAGEEYEEAAHRELREELGIDVDLVPVAKLEASVRTGEEFIWLYRAAHDGPFHLARSEIECGLFFPPALINRWLRAKPEDFAPGFVECWRVGQQVVG